MNKKDNEKIKKLAVEIIDAIPDGTSYGEIIDAIAVVLVEIVCEVSGKSAEEVTTVVASAIYTLVKEGGEE